MANTSKHKQQLRRAKRRATIAENNESLRRQVTQLQQYLQFVSGQAFESRALLFTLLRAQGYQITKAAFDDTKQRLQDFDLRVATDETDETQLTLTIEPVVKEASGPGLTVTKLADEQSASGENDVSQEILRESIDEARND